MIVLIGQEWLMNLFRVEITELIKKKSIYEKNTF